MKRFLLLLLAILSLASCEKESALLEEPKNDAVVEEIEGNTASLDTSIDIEDIVDHLAYMKKPEELADKFSYAYGNLFASSLSSITDDIDIYYFLRGVLDYYGTSYFTEEEFETIFTDYQKTLLSEAQARYEKTSSANLKSANDFLSNNAKRKNVLVTPSGLQYEVLRTGSSDEHPGKNDTVKIHYTITLLDGGIADSSYDREEMSEFKVSSLLPGVSEAVSLMSPGEKCRFWIHPDLAYGKEGLSIVGPNELVIFDIELFEILK